MPQNQQDNNNVACKNCGSTNTRKFGFQAGTQMYFCNDCRRKFKNDGSLYGGRVAAADISSALAEYYGGMSVNDIRNRIAQEQDYMPAQSTVYEWLDKYTDMAVNYYAQFKPEVGDVWVADETVIDIDGKDVWLYDVIDADTRFLLASKMSFVRTIADSETLLELAKSRAGKEPRVLLTDKIRTYPEAVRETLAGTVHVQTRPFTKGDNTNLIERFHGTLKERTKVMRGLKDTESALAFLDGFLVYYNFIRPHEALGGRTPAEAAGVNYNVKNWAGVIRLNEPLARTTERETFAPEYVTPPQLETARRTLTGVPFRPGDKPGSKHKAYDRSRQAATERRKMAILPHVDTVIRRRRGDSPQVG